ncbi:PucR family transcriptional regulator [Streptomyces sp. K1PN6]|uniref:PucR family transcriptional regulator n=1 Tax=Streptomyces acidicola TaxID=2596892 RepID=A0A5N8WSF6_9ACTN|nr:PucR family transcriptional regulator [Streptomyces acidicola]
MSVAGFRLALRSPRSRTGKRPATRGDRRPRPPVCRDGGRRSAGRGRTPAESLDELSGRFTTARDCSRVLTAPGIEAAAVAADAYLPYTTLFAHAPTSVRQFIDRIIGPVRRWDAERGTDLLATLHHFVDCDAGPARTARLMGVHSNTVLERLDRITRLLGSTWRDSESFFHISVAVRLHTLSETLRSSSGVEAHVVEACGHALTGQGDEADARVGAGGQMPDPTPDVVLPVPARGRLECVFAGLRIDGVAQPQPHGVGRRAQLHLRPAVTVSADPQESLP